MYMTISAGTSLTNSRPAQRAADAQAKQERKRRVLTHGTPSITASIADAIVIKRANIFFLCANDGCVSFDTDHGLGLYYNDCRYLNGYQLTVAGVQGRSLLATAAEGYRALFELTTPDIELPNGETVVKESIGIRWEHLLDGDAHALYDRITIRNFTLERRTLPIVLRLRAEFEDVFLVRGMLPPEGERQSTEPTWKDGTLRFRRRGIDGRKRELAVSFSVPPDSVAGGQVQFRIDLAARAEKSLVIRFFVCDGDEPPSQAPAELPQSQQLAERIRQETNRWLETHTRFRADTLFGNRLIDRSSRDLEMLRSWSGQEEFFSAGVPWFATLFGRDSIITAMQTLSSDPTIAENTLRVLAAHQGRRFDAWRDEQPGKILHELRVGELTRAGQIPYDPYYGTVDATPLFLLLIAQHAKWTGDLALFNELRPNVDLALAWIDEYGDRDHDGYIEYQSESHGGLINQGWKDSGDAIVDEDGTLAEPPIALVEVQAYVVAAKRAIASLFRRAGEAERASQLTRQADALRTRLNRDFWLEDLGTYAMALTADKRPTRVIASNAGHVLWAGAADPDKARRVTDRLLWKDMFSGWGIRTLASGELRFNPIGYHLGTVWPHDNAMIARGFRLYGLDDAAERVMTAVFEAALHFQDLRLPELYAGFPREAFGVPVHCAVANHPQAWGAGSVLYFLESTLGLAPNAFEKELRVVRPRLPPYVGMVELQQLRVGDARVHLRFTRAEGGTSVHVIDTDGGVDVTVDESDAAFESL
jgi:glycogen debranching enzyme